MVNPEDKKTVEAAITEITNRTPNEFRARLSDFAQQIASTQITSPNRLEAPTPPNIVVSETSLEPQPLTLGNLNSTVGPSDGAPASDGGGAGLLSFQVVLQKNSGTLQWGVWKGLLYALDFSLYSVSGFLASLDPSDTNWFNVGGAGNKIWLELAISSGTVVDAYINNSGFGGGEFEYVSDMGTPPTYSQTYCRYILSQSYTNAAGKLAITNRTGDKQMYNSGGLALDSGAANPEYVPFIMVQ